MNVIYIDLLVIKKLIGKPVEELSALQKWGLYLSYADDERYTDYIKQITTSEEGIMEADLIIEKMSEDDANWFRQNSYDTARRDYNDGLQNAEQKGIEKGVLQGEQKKAIENAKTMLTDNLSPEKVALYSGLPLEKVLELQKGITVEA